MIVRRLRFALLLCCSIVLLVVQIGAPAQTLAQAQIELEVFTPFGGQYVVGEWLPIRATLRNQGPTVTVTLTASLIDEPTQYVRTFRIAADTEQVVWLYVFIARPLRAITVILSTNTGVVAQQDILLLLRPAERMRAVIGPSPVNSDLFATDSLIVDDLPDHPLGLSNLSVLALFALSEPLTASQQTALLAWVANGGHLIVGGGVTAVDLLAALPPALQAAQIEGVTVIDNQPIAEYGKLELTTRLIGLKLAPVVGAQAIGDPNAPPWIEYPVGRGRVTQLAFAPEQLADWPGREPFWSTLAQPALLIPTALGTAAQITTVQEQRLLPVLSELPTLDLPAFAQALTALTWYALALTGILMIGWWRRKMVSATILALFAVISSTVGVWWAITNASPTQAAIRLTWIEVLDPAQAQAQTAIVMLSAMPRTENVEFAYPTLIRPLSGVVGRLEQANGFEGSLPQLTTQMAVTLEPWQAQGLWATALLPAPAVRAIFTVDQGRLRVDVQNDSPYTLRDTYFVYGDHLLFFGTLRPGARSVARWPLGLPITSTGDSLGQLIIQDLQNNGLLTGPNAEQIAHIRGSFIDAVIAMLPNRFDPGPFMLAWLNHDPLAGEQFTVERSETLLVLRPPISGQGELNLPAGWLRLDVTDPTTKRCLNDRGIQLSGGTADLRLRLPPALSSLQATSIQVRLESSGTLDTITIQVYNWVTDEWNSIPLTNPANFTIPAANPYLRAGEVRLRINGNLDRLGCVVAVGGVQGEIP
ncbi:MAG: hypothetical protein KatS3mg055_0787 [Chloroflexus sp.]|uniref:hypothetical protein n=1 Tax=Chloroflexus sp. TaxID=1904827 RepID=UPI0021DED813|nr:hypothetical protein [Chloroflexus sp.]GIV88269.1 MAG: hypothetical protein KatS3mg055_0787 [Chloroflexus sp.]